MTKKFKIATLALSACMALGVVGFTACGQAGKSAYDIWLEQGNTGTAQDFLDSLKGAAGTPGTPGNPGTPGTEGKSAYQVWLDAGNTGTEQDFLDSLEGAAGARGNKITKGEGAPASTEGAVEGDMYVDVKEWHVYFFESGAWNDYGSINGEGGSSEIKPTPAGTAIDIAANGEQEIDVTLSEGFHIIKADLGITTLTTGRLYAKVGETDSELVLSEARSEAAGGNKIYYGYINIKADTTKITISAKGEAVKGSISFEDYVQPTLKADGQPIEVPVNLNAVGTTGTGALKLKLDSSIVEGSYTVKIVNKAETTHLAASVGSIGLQIGDKMFTFIKRTYEGTGSSLSPTADNITAANGECWLYCPTPSGISAPAIFPITVTIEVKAA